MFDSLSRVPGFWHRAVKGRAKKPTLAELRQAVVENTSRENQAFADSFIRIVYGTFPHTIAALPLQTTVEELMTLRNQAITAGFSSSAVVASKSKRLLAIFTTGVDVATGTKDPDDAYEFLVGAVR